MKRSIIVMGVLASGLFASGCLLDSEIAQHPDPGGPADPGDVPSPSCGPNPSACIPPGDSPPPPPPEPCDAAGAPWSRTSVGSSGSQIVWSIDVGSDKSTVATGDFWGFVDFGGEKLKTSLDYPDGFIVKLDRCGNHLWSRSFGGKLPGFNGPDSGEAIATDANGDVFLVGTYHASIDLGGGPLPSGGGAFLTKLDAAGNLMWTRLLDESWNNHLKYLAVDAAGSVVVVGEFDGADEICPDTPPSSIKVACIVKVDADGNHLWSKDLADVRLAQVAVDASGSVLVPGWYVNAADLGGGPLPQAPQEDGHDAFLVKYDSDGNHSWSKAFHGSERQSASGVAVDSAGSIVLTGSTEGPIDLGGGPLPHGGGRDIFVASFDASGSHIWSRTFGDGDDEAGSRVAFDPSGRALVTGVFKGLVQLGDTTLTSAGLEDAFVATFNGSGSLVSAIRLGSAGEDSIRGLAIDASTNVYLGGNFNGTIDLGTGPLADDDGVGSNLFVGRLAL